MKKSKKSAKQGKKHKQFQISKIWKLIISIVICQLAGFIGSVFTSSSVSTWYLLLSKPSFNPPGWLFGPVWTVLYLMMGIALYLVWEKSSSVSLAKVKEVRFFKIALFVFFVQLALNILWSILFFGMRNPLAAFVEIIILWAAILATIILFYKISKPAAYLMIPYILWVSFAAVLNFSLYLLNA